MCILELQFNVLTSTKLFKKLLKFSKPLMKTLPIPINLSPLLPYFSSSLIRSISGFGVKKLSKSRLMLSGFRFSKIPWAVSFSKRIPSCGIGWNKTIDVVSCIGCIDVRLWGLSDLTIDGSRSLRNSLFICCKKRKFFDMSIIVKNYTNRKILTKANKITNENRKKMQKE